MTTAIPTAAVETVTPELARQWLGEHNTRNRQLRAKTVARYAEDIVNGRWELTGEAIKFATNGTLLDGQHRLAAIAHAEIAVPLLVVRGIANEAQNVMDTGAKRSTADALSLNGIAHAARVAALARFIIAMEDNNPYNMGTISSAAVFEYLHKNPDLPEMIASVGDLHRRLGVAPRVGDYSYWRLSGIDPEAAGQFFEAWASGANLPFGSPVLALIRRLRNQPGGHTMRLTLDTLHVIFRAWNAYRDGRTMDKVSVTGSKLPEPR